MNVRKDEIRFIVEKAVLLNRTATELIDYIYEELTKLQHQKEIENPKSLINQLRQSEIF